MVEHLAQLLFVLVRPEFKFNPSAFVGAGRFLLNRMVEARAVYTGNAHCLVLALDNLLL